jgi:hypothetical protein
LTLGAPTRHRTNDEQDSSLFQRHQI